MIYTTTRRDTARLASVMQFAAAETRRRKAVAEAWIVWLVITAATVAVLYVVGV